MNFPQKQSQPRPAPRLNLDDIRRKLDGVRGQQYWRSLDEVAETDEFRAMLHREFPHRPSEWLEWFSRRDFLKAAAASLALAGLTACTKQPVHEILPYVHQPENLVPGEPLYYATSMLLGGYPTGVLTKSREGHPIKIDGNPEHPASLGGSSIWMQASILDLYDPDRSQAFVRNGEISNWPTFLADANEITRKHAVDQGAGLCFLTETITSPALAAQLEALLQRFPKAAVCQFDSVSRDNVRAGAQLAFGEMVEAQHRFDKASILLSLDSDFLCTHPQRLRYTRDFADARRVSTNRKEMNRLYVVESTPTLTGSMADHRMPLASRDVGAFTIEIARQLGAISSGRPQQTSVDSHWIQVLVRDLQSQHGRSIVIAGEGQPPLVHALAHLLNEHLGNVGNTIYYTESAEWRPAPQVQSLQQLSNEMKAGAVETIFILGGNPVYSAPADFEFKNALAKVKHAIHLGLEYDETAAACTWHIPQTHYLESWGDARAFDGTISMMQPLIAPLYGGKSAGEILDALTNQPSLRTDYELVRDHWKPILPEFEKAWRRAICDGLIAGSAFPEKNVRVNQKSILDAVAKSPAASTGIELTFRPDSSVWDGRFANNGWLQECAKPINKLTWDNAVLVSPALAQREQLATDDVVEITLGGRTVRGPVWVMPGQAQNSITLHLGYGRERTGRVGSGVGFNAGSLRASNLFWNASGATIKRLAERHHLVSTQSHYNMDSADRQVHREGTLAQFITDPDFVKHTTDAPDRYDTLYNPDEFKYEGYKWGMSIDLTTCIGCSACLLACEVENNIPVVGKEQVNAHRELYWIRIDTYHKGTLDRPEFNHIPVPCMHCEHAPCELVCPVAATVHDHEGLNLMVYNRCVGTRFCSNNCPYKVRRFNFFQYTHYDIPSLKPMYNPEVTVRSRGVMEKCSYCVQRIAAARITSEKENRSIRDGEVRTACQDACPARAIVFGNLNDPEASVTKLKKQPLDYGMLAELNTRPRTTYLAKMRNPNPELETGKT